LIESLTKTRQSFVLTDPRLPDNPIVYASRQFLSLTGYERDQVVGRNCRFLQGLDTDPAAVAEIHDAIAVGKDGACCLLNYRADGTPFWNQFFVAPLRDKDNQIINFVSAVLFLNTDTTAESEEGTHISLISSGRSAKQG
jgi:PAS domain S-box-containing protein